MRKNKIPYAKTTGYFVMLCGLPLANIFIGFIPTSKTQGICLFCNKQLFYFLYFIFYFLFLFPHLTNAATLESPRHRIETNISEGQSKKNDKITHHSFAQKGYLISSRHDKNLFTINASNTLLDLLLTQQFFIAINPPDSGSYTIKTFKPEPFANFNASSSIPDTICDLKNSPCTPHKAQVWRLSSTYGFGYTVRGEYAHADFDNGSRFRPFSSVPIEIIRSDFSFPIKSGSLKKQTFQFTLKTILPNDHPTGTYRTLIHIIAFPDL